MHYWTFILAYITTICFEMLNWPIYHPYTLCDNPNHGALMKMHCKYFYRKIKIKKGTESRDTDSRAKEEVDFLGIDEVSSLEISIGFGKPIKFGWCSLMISWGIKLGCKRSTHTHVSLENTHKEDKAEFTKDDNVESKDRKSIHL